MEDQPSTAQISAWWEDGIFRFLVLSPWLKDIRNDPYKVYVIKVHYMNVDSKL